MWSKVPLSSWLVGSPDGAMAHASMFPQQLHRLRRTAGAAQGLANLLWHEGSGGRQPGNCVDLKWTKLKYQMGMGSKNGGPQIDHLVIGPMYIGSSDTLVAY